MASSGNDPTRPVPRSGATAAGDAATQASPTASGAADAPGGPTGDGGGSTPDDGDDRRRRNLILGALGVVALGVAVGVGLALATDSGNDTPAVSVTPPRITTSSSASSTSTSSTTTPSTTSSSSPNTTTSSTTTTSTTAPAPVITSFTAPDSNDCATQPQITLAWSTVNASGVTISVDGPGIFGSFAASGSTSLPFSCGPASHSYVLTTTGGAPAAKETRVVQQKP